MTKKITIVFDSERPVFKIGDIVVSKDLRYTVIVTEVGSPTFKGLVVDANGGALVPISNYHPEEFKLFKGSITITQ